MISYNESIKNNCLKKYLVDESTTVIKTLIANAKEGLTNREIQKLLLKEYDVEMTMTRIDYYIGVINTNKNYLVNVNKEVRDNKKVWRKKINGTRN